MKTKLPISQCVLMLFAFGARGQFVYDQQSSTLETLVGGPVIQSFSPYGQSFTPTFSSVSFIRLMLYDNNQNNGVGATISLNLRENSISGTLLATTSSVSLANGFAGTVNFLFPSEISLTPGQIYAFELIVQSGSDLWNASAGEYNYTGGTAFANGVPAAGSDLWFREGIVVPEPSSLSLIALSTGILLVMRRRRNRK